MLISRAWHSRLVAGRPERPLGLRRLFPLLLISGSAPSSTEAASLCLCSLDHLKQLARRRQQVTQDVVSPRQHPGIRLAGDLALHSAPERGCITLTANLVV